MSQQISTNTFGCAKWIVSSDATQGTHTTIASAITSASSGDTIFIRPGTYTENPTLKAGVNLAAFDCDALTPNVTIVGNCTLSTAGTVSISGIRLQTNSAAFLTVSGSAVSIVFLKNCYLNCSNATGISFTSSSASSAITITESYGNLGTTGIALFSMSAAGTLSFRNSEFTNTGGSSTANTISAGTLSTLWTYFNNPLTSSGTSAVGLATGTAIFTGTQNVTSFTSGGSGNHRASLTHFVSGTASAISVSNTLVCSLVTIDSSNTNATTGAGTITFTPLSVTGGSTAINTTTQTANFFGPTIYTSGLTFDNTATNTMSNYAIGTFTPTIVGQTTAGTTTYTSQNGSYIRVGNIVYVKFSVQISAATGTGNILFGGLPFTSKNDSRVNLGSVFLLGTALTWPAGTTNVSSNLTANNTTGNFSTSGTGSGGGTMQMANGNIIFLFSLTYQV